MQQPSFASGGLVVPLSSTAGAGGTQPHAAKLAARSLIKRGSTSLPPEQVAALRQRLQAAGMAPAVVGNVLKRALTSDLRRPEHLLAVWRALVAGLGGAAAADQALKGAGASILFRYATASLPAKMAAVRTELQLDQQQLATLVGRATNALGVPAADLAARADRYAVLLGYDSRQQAVEWLAKHPKVLASPMPDPEQRVQQVQAMLGVERPVAHQLVRTCISLVTTPAATLEQHIVALAAVLEVDRGQAVALVVRRPASITYSSSNLAATLDTLQRVLGASRESMRAAALASPTILTVPVAKAEARHAALAALAARSPAWSARWGSLSLITRCRLLACSDAVVARLEAVLAAGGDERYSMSSVVKATPADWAAMQGALGSKGGGSKYQVRGAGGWPLAG